jgi:hypothetical protein
MMDYHQDVPQFDGTPEGVSPFLRGSDKQHLPWHILQSRLHVGAVRIPIVRIGSPHLAQPSQSVGTAASVRTNDVGNRDAGTWPPFPASPHHLGGVLHAPAGAHLHFRSLQLPPSRLGPPRDGARSVPSPMRPGDTLLHGSRPPLAPRARTVGQHLELYHPPTSITRPSAPWRRPAPKAGR